MDHQSALNALDAIGAAFDRFDSKTRKQSILEQALQGADDPLEEVHAILSDVLDYLSSRDDCYDENIDDATDALYTALRRIQCQQEEIEDGTDDNSEHILADHKERAASMREHSRG